MDTRERDYDQIRNLFARYNQSYDFGDAAGVAALFTPNGVLDTTAAAPDLGGVYRGIGEIQGHVLASAEYFKGRVRTSTVQSVVDLHGDVARATSYVLVTRDYGPPELPGDLTHSELLSTGMYFDELHREGDGWKFTRREYRNDAHEDVLGRVGQRTREEVAR
ncbi:nuclear transport factor 2 family protein [Pseudarthrobacter phenanthrenivorans]|uniref:nuclear transport factor 2 family protein n=1 Tax=Pseudarthrobacter phenanthrenivorans TaxID=361575 RepID=UPI003450DF44